MTSVLATLLEVQKRCAADWFITTPLLLLDLLLMAALPLGDTLWIVFADVAMILTGLFGALTSSHFKWVRQRGANAIMKSVPRQATVAVAATAGPTHVSGCVPSLSTSSSSNPRTPCSVTD